MKEDQLARKEEYRAIWSESEKGKRSLTVTDSHLLSFTQLPKKDQNTYHKSSSISQSKGRMHSPAARRQQKEAAGRYIDGKKRQIWRNNQSDHQYK